MRPLLLRGGRSIELGPTAEVIERYSELVGAT